MQHPVSRRVRRQRLDLGPAQQLLQAVIDGRENLISVTQLARQLGLDRGTLRKYFPREYDIIAQRNGQVRHTREEERILRLYNEVLEAAHRLAAQNIYPYASQVQKLLTSPAYIREPRAKATLHATRRDLGQEN